MDQSTISLIIPTFIAGILTFFAPCTLPLVPGYLGFISGVSLSDFSDRRRAQGARRAIVWNGFCYTLGFSLVFIFFGVLFALGGAALIQYRDILQRVGGGIVILLGLFMLKVIHFPGFDFLMSERHPFAKLLKAGKPGSSLLLGASFAFGWTPCVGPILGSVLTLAAATATIGSGALLLSVFSLGLAVPFLLVALGIGSAQYHLDKIEKYLGILSTIAGIFVVLFGIMLATGTLGLWTAFFYRFMGWIQYDALLNYL